MDASGGFGGTLVFGKWKGRNVVRQLVTPANPHSAGQETARNRMRVAGAAQYWANHTSLEYPAASENDEARIRDITPSGFAWNGYLVDIMIGSGSVNYTAAQAAFAALSSGEKTAWTTAAAALTPPIPAVAQTMVGGVSTTALTAGNVFFIYVYTLYLMGLATVPGATPPTYT
jgi:hypothetical protein